MNKNTRPLLCLAAAMAFFVAAMPSAFAVATLEVEVVGAQDQSISSDSISLFNENNEEVEQDDRDDGAFYWRNLDAGTYTLKSDGQAIRTVTISPNDSAKHLRVDSSELSVSGANTIDDGNRIETLDILGPEGVGLGLAFRGIGKFASFDSRIDGDFSGSSDSQSGTQNLSGFGVGADLFFRPNSLDPFFFKFSYAGLSNLDDEDAKADFHTTPGEDSMLELQEDYYLRAMIGWSVLEQDLYRLSLLGGAQATRTEVTLITDESGGGGDLERFEESEFRWGPVLGLQVERQIECIPNLFIYGGVNASYMESMEVSGTSSLGFDYDGFIDDDIQTEGFLGAGWNF